MDNKSNNIVISDINQIRKYLRGVVLDYCEYSGLSYEEVVSLVKQGSLLAREEWSMYVKEGSDDEIERFYTQSKYYIYEVLQPYLEPEKYYKDINYLKILRVTKRILEKKGQCTVLDFGAGAGELCFLLAKLGCKVTYCDLPGKIADFALWRFKKYGINVSIVWSRIDNVDLSYGSYDLIVSDAVLEHLKPQYLNNFCLAFSNSLKDKGYLYLLWDPTYTKEYPYHILGLKAKEVDTILKKYSLLRISENVYIKSGSLLSILMHYLWKCKSKYIRAYYYSKKIMMRIMRKLRMYSL